MSKVFGQAEGWLNLRKMVDAIPAKANDAVETEACGCEIMNLRCDEKGCRRKVVAYARSVDQN
jgi:hypothetical protein